MKIVIAGGSGFLGSPLAEMYAEDGHDVRVLTRSLQSGETRHDPGTGVPGITRVGWKADGASGPWATVVEAADGVINLSGESLASKRWSVEAKKQLRESRLLATRSLAMAIRGAASPPAVLVSGSAVGFYGPADSTSDHGDRSGRQRFPRRALRRLGTRGPAGRAPGHTRRSAQDRRRPRTIGRRVAGNDAAVQVLRWRADRIRTSIRVVDPSPRLDRDRAVDRPDAERQWTGERDRAPPRDQPPPLDRARSRDASAQPAARAGLRREDRARRVRRPRC